MDQTSRPLRRTRGRRAVALGAIVVAMTLIDSALPAPSSFAARSNAPYRIGPVGPAPMTGAQRHGHRHLCSQPTHKRQMSCHAIVSTDPATPAVAISPSSLPAGYGPTDLRSAYGIAASGSRSATVAVVDAYDDPKAAADLAVYRSTYGLPPCTTANGCFRKVDQTGGTHYPPSDPGWAGEISLDLDMVSAICPGCSILLVEASTADFADLGAAVNKAIALGARFVSNSYGGGEDSSDPSADAAYFNHPGVAITASAGDSGYGVEYPAASRYVTAVGGTSLTRAANARGWTEAVWSTSSAEGTGSGCSAYTAKPLWQTDKSCGKRTVSDVSAVADPDTGVAVYDTDGSAGWNVYGGTSAAAPIIAGVYALAGTPRASDFPAAYPYRNPNQLWDVTGGSNGTCTVKYYCSAIAGYDGPTGLGTPHGLAAFTAPPAVVTIVNGGFEIGSISGWSVTGTDSVLAVARYSGAYGLQLGSTGPSGTSSASQTFTVAAGGTALSFWYRTMCPDTISRGWASVSLADLTAGTTLTALPKTCVRDSGWVHSSAPVIAGHKYTLTLTNRDDNSLGSATHTYYDGVTVS
ncbi:MAG TPA: S8 family serine peptidase [Actinocrinis sp.]|nr:S8 family serine peptidase [Actinocrinis sp.]